MNRWLENTAKATTPSHRDDDLTPILQKAKELVDRNWSRKAKSTAQLSDYELIKTLGQGSFGRVMLVRHIKDDRNFFAMKIMLKKKLIQEDHVEPVILEKRILQSVKFPFLISYVSHFKDNANLFLVMEYAPGGDMHSHIRKKHKFEEKLVAFYAAQVVLAFEYLHFVGIIYRDLKPENVVIDRSGFIKLTDFGFAKKIDRRKTKTMCGTPEYYAPEMIKKKSYSFPVDWYTLGILIFEMAEGHPPYRSSNMLRLFQLILDGRMKFPSYFSELMVDVIQSLTKQSTSLRLRTPKTVKHHQFFEKINWLQIYNKVATPPYIPEVRNEYDTRNFERQKEEQLEEEPEPIYVEEFEDF